MGRGVERFVADFTEWYTSILEFESQVDPACFRWFICQLALSCGYHVTYIVTVLYSDDL